MASKQAVLNGSASLLGGMTMAIARSAGTTIAAREGSSTSSASGEARYSPDYTLIFPPVSPTVHLASATTTRAWAGGTGSTVASLVIARTGNGDGSNTLRFVNDSPATPTTLRSVSMAGNGTTKPVGADDLGALEADYLHSPVGVRIFRGISLFACEVWVYDGSGDRADTANYLRSGVSLIQSQDDGQTFGLLWRGPAEASSDVTLGSGSGSTGFGSEWGFTVSAMQPDGSTERAVVSVFSYASGSNRSSTSYHVTMERDGGLWIMSANASQLVHYAGTSASGHCHTGHWIEREDGTCVFLGSDGDGSSDNRLIEVDVDSFAEICDGTTPVSGAYNVYEPGAGWGSIVEINGTKASGSGGGLHSQYISVVNAYDADSVALGADEGSCRSIYRATAPATSGDHVNERYGWGEPFSGFSRSANRCFGLYNAESQSANGACVASVNYGGGISRSGESDSDYADVCRIVYKPSATNEWGVVYAPQGETALNAQLLAVTSPAGRCWIGGSSSGLRYFDLPTTWRRVRPLYTGPGGTNYARRTPVQRQAPGTGNSVTIGATPPFTFPGDGAVLRFVSTQTASSNGTLGSYDITYDQVNKTHSVLTVRMWIYVPLWDGVTYTKRNRPNFRARLYTAEGGTGGVTTSFTSPRKLYTVGNFILADFQFVNASSGGDWDLSGTTAPLQIVFQMQATNASSPQFHEQEFYAQIDGVFLDQGPLPSYSPATNASDGTAAFPAENVSLTGIEPGSAWTIELQGLNARHGDDCTHATRDTYRTLATLWESDTKYVVIESDADTNVRIRTVNGGDTDNVVVGSLPRLRRSDPFSLILAWDGTDYTGRLSISGTTIQTISIASATAVVAPTEIRFGTASVEMAYARVVEGEALTGEEMESRLSGGLVALLDVSGGALGRTGRASRVSRVSR